MVSFCSSKKLEDSSRVPAKNSAFPGSRFTRSVISSGTPALKLASMCAPSQAVLGHKDKDNGALRLKVYSHVRQEHEAEMIRKVRFAPGDASS